MRKLWSDVLVIGLVLAIVGATGSLVAACGGSSGSAGSSSGTGSTPKRGGALTIAFQGEPSTLDPALNWDAGLVVVDALFANLLTRKNGSAEAQAELTPDMAEMMPTLSADGLTYTFKLKKGLKFAPPLSREVTAQDFKYSFERMMGSKLAPATYFYTGIAGAQAFMDGHAEHISGYKAVDPYTIEVHLSQPDPAIVYALSQPFCAVVPHEWVEKYGKQFGRHPLGSGPFLFDHWENGQEIVIKRNPNYTGATPGYVDAVTFKYSVPPSLAVMKLQRGDVDVLGDGVPGADLQRLKADPEWNKQIRPSLQLEIEWVFMSPGTKPFDDVRVRQAVSWAINREKIVKVLGGAARTLNQVYPEGMPGYEPQADYYSYDPAKAKALLAEAGLANGFKTELWTHNVAPFPAMAQSVQNDLAAVGIDASIKSVSTATYWTLMGEPGKMAMGLGDWSTDFPDPSDTIKPLFSKQSAAGGSFNAGGWWSPEVETLLAQSDRTTDRAKRLVLYQKMQQVIMQQAAVVPLVQPLFSEMFSKGTHNVSDPIRLLYLPIDCWKD